nr:exodeoxyribonuclease V subunit gamma [Nocardioides soli]
MQIHRAARTDVLADRLGDLLAAPLDDPFAEEVVVVPAKGVERWLTQRLSHRLGAGPRGGDGVCAGVRFLNPRSLVSLLLGRERDDPWDPERLVWPLLATIDESLDDPRFETLARHLGHGREGPDQELRRNRRYSVAIRLAHLYASYAGQRPGLVTAWRQGDDGDLADDLRWQAELWRRLLEKVAAPPPDVRHAETCAALEEGGADLPLPGRLSLFGHTRIPVTEVALLRALGEHRDVHLFLPQPSPTLWDDLAGLGGVVSRAEDASSERVGHPLLASLGRDARELRRTLDGIDAELVPAPEGDPATLLGWLQHDLRANHAPSYDERAGRLLDAADTSLQVHACHGPARQVDVLREVLVGLLQDDPTLEPRDILVMCPDIESYAPLISAGFGLATSQGPATRGHPAHLLRVKLADRALTSTNPLLAVAGRLLELSGGRVTAADVLDLAGSEPCRLRFGFTDDELDRVSRWVARAGVRWGLDEDSRRAFQMERFPHNTWRMGLDRILLGVAMSGDDHRHLGRGLPLDDIGSSEIDLAGRLAELVERLDTTLTGLAGARTVADWSARLRDGVRSLTDVDADDAWQLPQFERELARAATSSHEGEVELRLSDVRAMLQSRLAGRPTRANFRTGTLTVATLVPMRSVPHRVVCLIGLDDGVFPRAGAVDGDDVLGRRPLTGERDARSEDRQLLLDAVLAATERLVITYSGADEQSGARRPPAVPLGEILDAADRTTAAPVRDRVETRHPLQPYDARNFAPERPFSFDAAALAGARSAWSVRREPQPLLTGPLPPRPREDVSLQDLKAFLAHPVRTFLRERLDVATPFEPDDLADAIPVTLDSLEKWQVGDRLLRELLAGQDPVAVMTAEQLAGTLPPGGLGRAALNEVVEECQRLWARTVDVRQGERRSVDVDVDLGDGRRLTGTVPGVYGSRVVSLGYSRLNYRQRLQAWADLLALSASYPDQHWTAHAIGRERAGPKRAISGPLDHRAVGWLRDLVDLRERGLREPLPVPVKSAGAWAEAHARELMGQDFSPAEAAGREWETDPHNMLGTPGEDDDSYHQRVFGARAPVRVLLDAGLPEHAWRIWEPLLTGAEKVGPL